MKGIHYEISCTYVEQSKAVGEQSEVYISRLDPVKIGDVIEITNPERETLNVAKVVEVKTQDTAVIEMIA